MTVTRHFSLPDGSGSHSVEISHSASADQSISVMPSAPVLPAPLIRCVGLRKEFHEGDRSVAILRGIDLAIHRGEMVAVMGRSGSGKSTLLNCLAGLDDPDEGIIELFGQDLRTMSLGRRAKLRRTSVGFVFQQYQLVPYLTAAQNVALPLRLAHRRVSPSLVNDTLAQVNMTECAHERTSDLSGGEQQRIALARILAQQPTIVMADEPTGALDTAMVSTVMTLLRGRADNGCVLLVTHDPLVAVKCDRILLLQDGVIIDELRSHDVATVSEALSRVVRRI